MQLMRVSMMSGFVAIGFAVAYAQLGSPQYPPGGGQYPPGQYPPGQGGGGMGLPRIPMPKTKAQKKKDADKAAAEKKKQDEVENVVMLRGTMRRVSEKQAIIETKDKRIIRIETSAETKYVKKDTTEIKPADLQLGDQLLVDAVPDEKGYFRAVKVTLERPGTAAERVAARDTVAEVGTFEEKAGGEAAAEAREPERGPDDPPKLTKAPKEARPTVSKAAEPEPEEAEKPVVPIEVKSADEDGRPKLTRGRPAGSARRPDEVAEVRRPAEARPMVLAPPPVVPAVEEPERVPEPEADKEEDPFIVKARQMAFDFTETLPAYLAKQLVTRYIAQSLKAGFQAVDRVASDVVYENGAEHYRNVTLNGKAAKGKVEETGSWSRGEFGTVVKDLFSGSTAADFQSNGSGLIAGRTARMYRFRVDQANSHWQITGGAQTYLPGYKGMVWLDRETARVLRIEMQASRMPKEFPLDTLESATEFEFIRLGTASFLLPTHAETLSCIRGTSQCSKNVIEFRNYKKFGAESNVTFQP